MTLASDQAERSAQSPAGSASLPPPWDVWLRSLFTYDVIHVRQRVLTVSEKYEIKDQHGRPLFFVERPPRLAINIAFAALLGAIRIGVLLAVGWSILQGHLSIGLGIALLILSNFGLGITGALVAPYRPIEIFTDDRRTWRILAITQDNKIGLTRNFTLYDCLGNEVARFRRMMLPSIFRVTWRVETPRGEPITRVREDSLPRALLRRYLGPLYGLLRTNFNFEYPNGSVYGKFDRKFTLTDQYLLDLRGDPSRSIDRRVTLAMAILLDTGERR